MHLPYAGAGTGRKLVLDVKISVFATTTSAHQMSKNSGMITILHEASRPGFILGGNYFESPQRAERHNRNSAKTNLS